MSTKRIPLRHTGSAITECWKTAETRTSDAVQAKYWAPGEENITFLFSGELRQAISDANQQGAFGRAFVSDLIAAYPELRAAPHLSHTLTNRLLGSVTFHGHRHEGSTSGSDLGLVIRQPSIVVNGWKPDHLTIHDDYAPGLLVQAKLGRPVKAQPSTIHWRSLTDDQRLLIPVHSAYYSLLLYQWQNPEGTGLCRFQWQTCHGFRVDEIAEWLDEGSFPNLHDSETVLSGLATEKLGTDQAEILRTVINPTTGTNPVLEIRIGWPPGDVPPSGIRVALRGQVKGSYLVVRNRH